MGTDADPVADVLEHAYRDEWSAVVATLARRLGDLGSAEDAAAEAFAAAARVWARDGTPPNPGGWLMTTAWRKAVDQLRRNRAVAVDPTELLAPDAEPVPGTVGGDDRLGLVFACCHPALALEVRVALTLRYVAGLTTRQIAAAFVLPEATLAQRLVRAKRKISEAGIRFEVPGADRWAARLGDVRAVIYLVFNEGYAASGGEKLIDADLCEEAIWLGRLLHRLLPDDTETAGLLALMLLHHSRAAARQDPGGEAVLLADQDRTRWDAALAAEGTAILDAAVARREPGPYQVEAAIAATHAAAGCFEATDWPQIAALYGTLARLSPSPVVEVNRAVAAGLADGPQAGLAILEPVLASGALTGYAPLHAAHADLLERAGRAAEAAAAWARAERAMGNSPLQRELHRRRGATAGDELRSRRGEQRSFCLNLWVLARLAGLPCILAVGCENLPFATDQGDSSGSGPEYLCSPGALISDHGLPSALRARSPSSDDRRTRRQTCGGDAMNGRKWRRTLVLTAAGGVLTALSTVVPITQAAGAAPTPTATGALVTVGSPTGNTPENSQNEPALAVDPTAPNILAAGANDLVDMQPCSQKAATTAGACSFPLGTFNLGVGLGGVYFSFNSGHSWIQPTYQGLTAANCDPTVEPCTPQVGPIHTVPNFYENGLRSRSDPGVAFGPVPKNGVFSYANGTRLYYANLATNLTDTRIEQGGINAATAITVSHIDNLTPAGVADQANWSKPYFVPANIAASSGLDKEQVWADNAASSPFFGHVYMCYTNFLSLSKGHNFAQVPTVATSDDGGLTWKAHQVAPPTTVQGNHQGCTVRTDSHGVVYDFITHFSATSNDGAQTLVTSTTGGDNWGRPVDFMPMNAGCFFVDPVEGRCTMEGPAGARIDLMAMPSVDIANGAPTGADATNEIVDAWTDGRFGLNHEVSMLSYSTDGGQTWSTPATVSLPGDRALYTAPGIAPDGSRVYVAYNAFTTPFATTTSAPRLEHGVLLSSAIGTGGAPTGFTTDFVGPSGDARGTSQGRILYNEFLGDYVYAIGTRTYGTGVWTDVPNTADCPAMDTWRQASFTAGHHVFPAPWPLGDCPANFGNNDINSATTAP